MLGPRAARRSVLLFAGLASGCGPSAGGLTAELVFAEGSAAGTLRRGLRAAQVPELVGRLDIEVLAPDGTSLGGTVLAARPAEGEVRLRPEGGTWQIDQVEAGVDRVLEARAFLEGNLGGGLGGVLAYVGRKEGIEIRPGEVTEAGRVVLVPAPERPPEADVEPPAPPLAVSLEPAPEGEQLILSWTDADSPDLAGYLLAVATRAEAVTATAAPRLERRARPAIGSELGPGFTVLTRLGPGAGPTPIMNLEDGAPVRVALYAFDAGPDLEPLNWAEPAEAIGVPLDTAAPAAPRELSATLEAGAVRVRFVAPGEDGDVGTPARYEIRVAATRAALAGSAIERAPRVPAPRALAPGERVSTSFAPSAYGLGAGPVFVAARSVDAAGNVGPAAVAEAVSGPLGAPTLAGARPALPLAGGELRLSGEALGVRPGRARWVETSTTRSLEIVRWAPTEVTVLLPPEARTGRIELLRAPDGRAAMLGPVGVLARLEAPLPRDAGRAEIAGGRTLPNGSRIYALHREVGAFGTPEHGIRRFSGATALEGPLLPFFEPRSEVVAADHRADVDLFAFVSGGDPAVMTTAVVSGSTVAPDATRNPRGVLAGGADGLGIALLPGGSALRPPALLVFTRAGILRAARVRDLRLEPFGTFTSYTSTSAGYAAVQLARGPGDELRLALAETPNGGGARLALWSAPPGGDPAGLSPILHPSPPPTTSRIEILGYAQTGSTASAGFVVAHERPSERGPTRIYVGLARDWGRAPFLPLSPSAGPDERLEDIGLVDVGGEIRLVVLSSQLFSSSARLRWTEIALASLEAPGPAAALETELDVAPDELGGRLGCRPRPSPGCLAVWSAAREAQVFFERR